MEADRSAGSPQEVSNGGTLQAPATNPEIVPLVTPIVSHPLKVNEDIGVPNSAPGDAGQAFKVRSSEFVGGRTGGVSSDDQDEEYVPPKRKKRALSDPSNRSLPKAQKQRLPKQRGSRQSGSSMDGAPITADQDEWSVFDDNGVTRFRCELCGKLFNNRSNLLRHLPNHWDKKPYECADCGRAFPRRGQLMQHIRSHQDDFPFKCPSCTKSFKWKQSLRRHHCTRTFSNTRDAHHSRNSFQAPAAPPPNARYLQSIIPVEAAL